MKIIISESQFKLILENEEYVNKIVNLLSSEDRTNNELGFMLMKYNDIPIEPVVDGVIDNLLINSEKGSQFG